MFMEKIKKHRDVLIVLGLVLVASFVFFFQLGSTYLNNWDEAWYASISKEMYRSGNMLRLSWNGGLFLDKPPLYYWASALSYRVLGEAAFAARFMSALSGVGLVVLVFLLGRQLFNRKVGVLVSVVLLSTLGFITRVRTGNLDATFTFFLMLTIYLFYKALRSKHAYWYIGMGVSIALAYLTKGFIAFLFPTIAFLYGLLKERNKRTVIGLVLAGGVSIFIISAWVIFSYIEMGNEFLYQTFFHQFDKVFGKQGTFIDNISADYITHIKHGMKFWILFLIPSFVWAAWKLRNDQSYLLVIYSVVFFVALTVVESKSNWFLMPLYPVFGIVISWAFVDVIERFSKPLQHVAIGAFVVFSVSLPIYYRDHIRVPDYVVRLVKKRHATFPCKTVHEQIEIEGTIGNLKEPMIHNTNPTFEDYMRKADTYTSLTAQEMIETRKENTIWALFSYMLIKPIMRFLALYIRHKGVLDGWRGFVWAVMSAMHYPMAYIKYSALQQEKDAKNA